MSTPLILRLVASSIRVSQAAGKVIRDIMKGGELGIVDKGIDDPQTEADRRAQQLIFASLVKKFPKIAIFGEEGKSDLVNAPPEYIVTEEDEEILQKICPEALQDIPDNRVVVWVDPLDGTSEYTAGFLDHVTVLIGIAVDEAAVAGVMHQPYFKNPDNTFGRTIWGITGVGIGGLDHVPLPGPELVITTTRTHSNELVTAAIDSLKPIEVIRVGGAGYKVLQLLEGKANAYVFASKGMKKWDTCAPEAILETAGGQLTDITGGHYCYDVEVGHHNKRGVLATPRTIKHHFVVSSIPDSVKQALTENAK